MIKRNAYNFIKEWKETKQDEALIIYGARQVGKTFLVKEFGNRNYKKVIYIDFIDNPSLKKIFEGSLSTKNLISNMSFYIEDYPGIDEGNTLLIIDEIQECQEAITALKSLAQSKILDCIATGSLLGLKYIGTTSYPVGYVATMTLYPLSFDEYVIARGLPYEIIDNARNCYNSLTKIDPLIHDRLSVLFKEYIIVGGMPKVVNSFLKNLDFKEAYKEQEKILESYRFDITRYANNKNEISKIHKCFDSIPLQLAKENRKFQYSVVQHKATKRSFEDSIVWLQNANLTYSVTAVSKIDNPLNGYCKDNYFKVYMFDTGLLTAMSGINQQRNFLKEEWGNYKGGIYENIIACSLIRNRYKLYYYETRFREIDFVIEREDGLTIIEVKATKNRSKSFELILEENPKLKGIKFTSSNICVGDKYITLPHYLSFLV